MNAQQWLAEQEKSPFYDKVFHCWGREKYAYSEEDYEWSLPCAVFRHLQGGLDVSKCTIAEYKTQEEALADFEKAYNIWRTKQ